VEREGAGAVLAPGHDRLHARASSTKVLVDPQSGHGLTSSTSDLLQRIGAIDFLAVAVSISASNAMQLIWREGRRQAVGSGMRTSPAMKRCLPWILELACRKERRKGVIKYAKIDHTQWLLLLH
jgi:hypothetical protein